MTAIQKIETTFSQPLLNHGWELSQKTTDELRYRHRADNGNELRIVKTAFSVYLDDRPVQGLLSIEKLLDYLSETSFITINTI